MLNHTQIVEIKYVRNYYYSLNTRYGEVFDSNFLDFYLKQGNEFSESITEAKNDTDCYIRLEHEEPKYPRPTNIL